MTKKTPFSIKLLILFLSLLLLGTIFLAFLWSYLAEYEKANPKNCINEYIKLIKSSDYETAMQYADIKTTKFFDASDYEKYVKNSLGSFDDLHIGETASENTQGRHFQLTGSKDKSIDFILTQSNKKLKYNFSTYNLKQQEISKISFTIQIPKEQIPIVNGVELDKSYIVDDKSIVTSFDSLNDKSNIPTIVKYKVDGLVFRPEVLIKGLDKSRYICDFTEGNLVKITLTPDDKDKETYEKLAIETGKAYAKYVSKDIEFSKLRGYMYEDTSFFKSLTAYSNVWTVEHNAPVFENVNVANTVEFSENHFQTDVSFDYILTKWKIKKVYPTKYRLSFIKIGNDFKLANLELL